MPKATSPSTRSPKQNLDANLIAMIDRHARLWAEWGRLDERDPRVDKLSNECIDLELKIVATPAHTARGLLGKRRIIRKTEFVSAERGFDTGDVSNLVDMILLLDAERIGAGRAASTMPAVTMRASQ